MSCWKGREKQEKLFLRGRRVVFGFVAKNKLYLFVPRTLRQVLGF